VKPFSTIATTAAPAEKPVAQAKGMGEASHESPRIPSARATGFKDTLACLVVALCALAGSVATAAPALDGNAVRSGRVTFTVDGSGLPAAITIPPRPAELPLAHRGGNPPADVLATIGRGPLLPAPARFEAIVDGKSVAAEVKEPAKPAAADGGIRAASKLAAGPLAIVATTTYRDTGLVDLEIKTTGNDTVGGLKIVVPLAGAVDLAIPLAAAAKSDLPLGAFTPAAIDGVAWSSAKGNGSKAVVPAPGLASPVFFGSGDRGIVFTASDAAGWPLDPAGSSFEIVRDQAGAAEAHLYLCNQPKGLAGEKSFKCSLQVLPATAAEPASRAAAWQKPAAGGRPVSDGLKAPIVEGSVDVPAAALFLPNGSLGPIEVFRYLSGAPAGLAGVIRGNPASQQRAGGSASASRALIGRALLHGLVVDGGALAHRTDLLRAVKAIAASGLFDDAAAVETVPYWRSAVLARYGEEFKSDGGFETASENPVARVHTAAFVLARGGKPDGPRQTLFVVVNEGDKPVREQFYVTNPKAAFGGPNKASAKRLAGSWDYTGIATDSDWRKDVVVGSTPGTEKGLDSALVDLEDGGFVAQTTASEAIEVYGPLFIPARSYRLLWGCGDAAALPGQTAAK